jgi:hypothetical protein
LISDRVQRGTPFTQLFCSAAENFFVSRMLTQLENWNRYSDVRERLDAENALFPYPSQVPGAQPARGGDVDRTDRSDRSADRSARQQPRGYDRFGDGFESASTSRASLLGTQSTSAAQIRQNYFADGFQAASAPRMSLGNDNASLTFGAAAAPQDTSFTPTLADVELLLGGS